MPKLYTVVDGIPVQSNNKTLATEKQIKTKEIRITEFKKQEYPAQHIILSTTLTHIGAKIKNIESAKSMWDSVKANATMKTTLYLIDAET